MAVQIALVDNQSAHFKIIVAYFFKKFIFNGRMRFAELKLGIYTKGLTKFSDGFACCFGLKKIFKNNHRHDKIGSGSLCQLKSWATAFINTNQQNTASFLVVNKYGWLIIRDS